MTFYDASPWKTSDEAVQQARNVFCVGRNYRDHAIELGNDVPTAPLLFGKWTHALQPCSGALALPAGRTNIHHELEIVLFLTKPYVAGDDWRTFVGGIALGLDLTDRDAQNRLKAAGQPWEYAKSFPQSAVVTDFYRVQDWEAAQSCNFSLTILSEPSGGGDERTVQSGRATEMLFPFERLIEYVGTTFGFGSGDMLYTGTPAGVGPLRRGDSLTLKMGDAVWGTCQVE